MTSENPPTLDEAITMGPKALIDALDRTVPTVTVRSIHDIRDPAEMAFEAGRRSIVDMLIATLDRRMNP